MRTRGATPVVLIEFGDRHRLTNRPLPIGDPANDRAVLSTRFAIWCLSRRRVQGRRMTSLNGAHTESKAAWPEPLAGVGVWNIGALALPAVMLSICSAAVFALVLLFSILGDRQELFVLPFPGTLVIAGIGALLSWTIVLRCRRRPGRLIPRVWALVLACSNSAIALLASVLPGRSWVLALALAGVASAATLAPRLARLRPDSAMVQWIAPFSVLLVLLVVVPASCAARRAITSKTEQRVEQRIRQFRVWRQQVREVTSFDWRHMEESSTAASKTVATLRTLSFENRVDEADLWRAAAALGRDEELATVMRELVGEIVAGLDPERAPRMSDVREAAVRWDAEEGRWRSYPQFAALSEVTGTYARELGRLFGELESHDETGAFAKLVDYREDYAAERAVLRTSLNETASTWADNWSVYRVPQHEALLGRARPALHEVLRASFLQAERESFAPGQLVDLMALPLDRLQAMAQGSTGCAGEQSALRGAPGCHCQSYDERGREYFRLDCYSYSPRAEGAGADLRIEMRLVYRARLQRLEKNTLPAEIYFHFLIPETADADAFSGEVMTDLATAVRKFLSEGRVRSTDRGGSVAGGFVIEQGRAAIQVLHPRVVVLNGLEPAPKALLVRVVRTAGG